MRPTPVRHAGQPASGQLAQKPRRPRSSSIMLPVILAAGALAAFLPLACAAADTPVKIAVHASTTGEGKFSGQALLEAVRMAEGEVNASGIGPRITLMPVDDESSDENAVAVAHKIANSDAALVVGPSLTTAAEMAAPVYEKAGIAALVATAHGDAITAKGSTAFLMTVSTGDMGKALANYLRHVLAARSAVVIHTDDGYGKPFVEGFRSVAQAGGVKAVYPKIKARGKRDKRDEREEREEREQLEAIVLGMLSDPDRPAVVLGMTQDAAAPILTMLRRRGYKEPILGTTSIARASFAGKFQNEPEEKRTRGFFTDGVYAASPVMLDSATAGTLAFARRFRARYKHEPSWEAVQAYDTLKLAAEAIRSVSEQRGAGLAPGEWRKALLDYFKSPGIAEAVETLAGGGVWLQGERRRLQPIRIGRYQGTMLKSALVQLVPVPGLDPSEAGAHGLVDQGGGHYARRQQVVYAGMYLNEILRMNIAQPSFTADFYFWMRYAKPEGTGAGADSEKGADADPENIVFPDLVQGAPEEIKLSGQSGQPDGTHYRLWHMRGEFKNDFDFHHFPLDRQTLTLRFLNAHADSNRIVYVKDREEPGGIEREPYRNLTQWDAASVSQQRYASRTRSGLGDERPGGLEQGRELSGYNLTVELRRSVIAAMTKTMLPLVVMTLIMYAALFFPHGLVKETVTVVITVALSGTVLLSSINAQLGDTGYILAVEYVFYLFFGLCLFSIVGVLTAERLRVAERVPLARRVTRATRAVFGLVIAGAIGAGWLLSLRW